jgi:hypothetical protein
VLEQVLVHLKEHQQVIRLLLVVQLVPHYMEVEDFHHFPACVFLAAYLVSGAH